MIDFAVVGAQKAGTTHLNVCLADHPELYLCPDEVPYFEDPFYGNTDEAELARVFQPAGPRQLRGVHRPEYLGRPECAARIRADAPDAKILIVLRDPVRRAVSAYFWYVQFGLLPLLPVEEGMQRLLDGGLTADHPRAPEILEFGRYGEHVGRYLDTFGTEQVLVLRTNDLRTPEFPPSVYRFLGVRADHVPRRLGRQTNVGVYEPHRLRFLRARRRFVFSWDSTTTYTYRPLRLRRPFGWAVAASFVAADKVVLSRLYGNPLPVLPDELEARLRAYYDDDVRLLEARLGRVFHGWRELGTQSAGEMP